MLSSYLMVLVFKLLWRGNTIYMGAALGSHLFTEQYVSGKVDCMWWRCVSKLSDIAKVHPHAASSAFTCGLCNKWT